jgi:RNA polymerase sigma factor (sigma-70 family)
MSEDAELLRRYAAEHSEAAFTELIRRHVDLVYSAALRLVNGDAHRAQDVTQQVFAEFARQAKRLRRHPAPVGWLYTTTRLAALRTIRTERRRSAREQEATTMNELLREPAPEPDWVHLRPVLEDAMHELGETDRRAVLLRFFQNKSLKEVGMALGLGENAARMRVERALEKLRAKLVHRGITTTATALSVVISVNAVQVAPAVLAATLGGASLAGAAAGTGTTLTLIKLMTMTKLQAAVIGAIVIAGVATPLVIHHQAKVREESQALHGQIAQLKAGNESPAGRVAQLKQAPAPRVEASNATNPPVAPSPYERLSEFLTSHHELSREEIGAYLQQNKRNAESLLAAYRMSHDQSYLREAATNFPNTPFVQFAIIADKVFPEEQRKWIDAFKASAPDNALAWYFSALDHFNLKQPDLAIQELAEATRRQVFDTYAAQASQAVEEMCNLAGWPPLAAKAWAPSSESASYLPSLRNLANQMMQTQQQDLTRGDAASANSMASMGMVLGNTLRAGGPIDQLVGIAIEKNILGKLDPAVNYDFLGRPVNEVLAELDRQKQATRDALNAREKVLPTLNETELASYFERKKLYGEVNAVQWLQSKHSQP